MKVRSLAVKIVLVMLALMVPSLWAQDGFNGALSRAMVGTPSHLAGRPFGQPLVAADFDNDRKPDGAVLFSSGQQHGLNSFRIELHLSSGDNASLTFESSESSPGISAVDVNGDGATDIVVEQPFTHKQLQVWLNNGNGGFSKVRVENPPSSSENTGERLDVPNSRPDLPGFCLTSQRGFDPGALSARGSPVLLPAFRRQTRPTMFAIGADNVTPNPSRGPPSYFLL